MADLHFFREVPIQIAKQNPSNTHHAHDACMHACMHALCMMRRRFLAFFRRIRIRHRMPHAALREKMRETSLFLIFPTQK
jgi:hypothetical protein